MTWHRAVLFLLASFSFAAAQEGKPPPANQIEVLEARSERTGGRITLDGQIRNVGLRPLSKLVLLFDLLDVDRKTIARRNGQIEETVLEPGEESSFHFYVPDHARAVEFSVHAQQAGGRDVDVVKSGPYPIY